jgi:hypothetical protein
MENLVHNIIGLVLGSIIGWIANDIHHAPEMMEGETEEQMWARIRKAEEERVKAIAKRIEGGL